MFWSLKRLGTFTRWSVADLLFDCHIGTSQICGLVVTDFGCGSCGILESRICRWDAQECGQLERNCRSARSFEQDTDEIVFHRDDMALPLPTADEHLLKVLCKNADQLLKERAEANDDFMHAVTELIID